MSPRTIRTGIGLFFVVVFATVALRIRDELAIAKARQRQRAICISNCEALLGAARHANQVQIYLVESDAVHPQHRQAVEKEVLLLYEYKKRFEAFQSVISKTKAIELLAPTFERKVAWCDFNHTRSHGVRH